jgi:Flp pilus assembly protein TadG
MHVLTLIAIGMICCAFRTTRLIGVATLSFIALLFPPLFLALLALAAIGAFFYFKRKGVNDVFRNRD